MPSGDSGSPLQLSHTDLDTNGFTTDMRWLSSKLRAELSEDGMRVARSICSRKSSSLRNIPRAGLLYCHASSSIRSQSFGALYTWQTVFGSPDFSASSIQMLRRSLSVAA